MRFLARFGVSFLLVSAAFAQSDRGTITGTVTDPASAVIPGASVTAVSTETGSQFQTVTTATGNYTILSLPAGVYDVTIEMTGFSKAVRPGIRVQVAQTARIDVALQVGSTAESVTVTTAAPLLRTESAEQSTTVSRERLNSLPLNFAQTQGGAIRQPLAFVTLSPGAWYQPGSQSTVRVNGAPNTTFKIMVEGQDATNDITPSTTNHNGPSVEAMEEFSLQTSNFAAEYGQVSGGLFNFTARSGSNQYHGAAYEYLTNEALNAGIPFTNDGKGHLIRARSRRHDFGGTFGGPVYIPKIYNGHNRTFFFFNIETYYDRKFDQGSVETVPTALMRQGNFSEILTGRNLCPTTQLNCDPVSRSILENTIYDPLTSRVVNGQVVRDPFNNNTIPSNRLDPVSLKIQALIPQPTRPDRVNNWDRIFPNPRTQINKSIKVDHNFSSTSKLSVFWMNYTSHEFSGVDGLPIPVTAVRDKYVYSHTFRVNYDRSLTPTLLLHIGVGDQRFHNPDSSPPSVLENYDTVKELGLVGGAVNGFPRLAGLSSSFGGSLSMGPTNANKYYTEKPTAILNATLIRGSHAYKAGAEWHIDAYTDRNTRQSTGVYNFSNIETTLPSTQGQSLSGGTAGFPYASFVLGLVDTASVNAPQDPQLRKQSWALFIQDTWKLTRKLTLDYGLRYDHAGQGREIWDRASMFEPKVSNPSAGGLLGGVSYEGYGTGRCNCRFAQTYKFAFGPRLGMAYQINDKTVLRGGWGISYGPTPYYNYITNSPILGVGFNNIAFSSSSYGDPAVVMRTGLIYNSADLYKVTLDPGVRPSAGQIDSPPYWIDRNGGRPPRINQWNVSLQRQLSKNLVIEAAYVGNRGVWFEANGLLDINGSTAERLRSFGLDITNAADRAVLTSRLSSATAQARGFKPPYAGYPDTLTVAQSLRPYPQFGNIPARFAPLGSNWYNALQTKATKRYSYGLDMTASFTWQKELALGADGGTINDSFNRPNQKVISNQSMPLVFVTAINYQLPALSSNRFLRLAVKDWTIGGLLRYASGLPIAVPGAQNALSGLLFRNTVANRVPGEPLYLKDLNCHCIDPNKDFVLNPKAWSDPAQGQWGYSAAYYGDYRQERRYDEQMTIGRIFQVREKMRFHIRAEFFNIFNRTYLNSPSSTNALQTQSTNAQGVPTSGFGRIDTSSILSGYGPRNGQIVARFEW